MRGSRRALHASTALVLGLVVTLAGCGGDDGPRTETVMVGNSGYKPERLRIETGDRVTFVNRTDVALKIEDEYVSDGGRGFSTRKLGPGKRQTIAFHTPRLYGYESSANPIDRGVIEVAAGADEAADSTTALRITRGFGRKLLWSDDDVPLHERETVLRQLEDEHSVGLGDTGRFVTAIDGLRGGFDMAQPHGWATNVNGIETDVLPRDYELSAGDMVQWDYRDWFVTLDVRATVGAFPRTFTRGVFGRRFPVEVTCVPRRSPSCQRVKDALRDAGVRIDGRLAPGTPPPRAGEPRRAHVLVGEWRDLRDRRWPSRVDEGPSSSGIFARFPPDVRSMRLLDWNAHYVRSSGAGTGLVGAMRPTEEDLLWMVTGVDETGVERAARALRPDALRDAFAVAVTADGVEKLPLPPPGATGG